MASFADRLKEVRERKGLSQYALARITGLSKQGLSNLELGAREPSWDTVQRLALALGVSCTEFVDPGIVLPVDEGPGQPGRPRKTPDADAPAEGPVSTRPGKPRKAVEAEVPPAAAAAEVKATSKTRKGKR
jgi:transcriptional regulator with XRE-family HTH domain